MLTEESCVGTRESSCATPVFSHWLGDVQVALSFGLNTQSDSEGTHSHRLAAVYFLKVDLNVITPATAIAGQSKAAYQRKLSA